MVHESTGSRCQLLSTPLFYITYEYEILTYILFTGTVVTVVVLSTVVCCLLYIGSPKYSNEIDLTEMLCDNQIKQDSY